MGSTYHSTIYCFKMTFSLKSFLFVAVYVLASQWAVAQYDPFFRIGLKAGANLSNVQGNDLSLTNGGSAFNFKDNENRSLGFVGGVYMRFGRKFYVQPEFLISQKGGAFNVYKDGLTNPEGQLDVRFSNLDVPVLLGWRLGRILRINAGPMASLRLGSGKIGESFRQYTGQDGGVFLNEGLAFGYQAGVGLDLGRISLDVRYEGNLTEVAKIQFNNTTTAAQFGRQNNLWQATVGFALF